MTALKEKRCLPCEGGVPAMDADACRALTKDLAPRWTLAADHKSIACKLEFKNYYHTTAFINALVYLAHREDHHPDVSFGYKTCSVRYTTHAVGGLSENDFICAAKVDALLDAP